MDRFFEKKTSKRLTKLGLKDEAVRKITGFQKQWLGKRVADQ